MILKIWVLGDLLSNCILIIDENSSEAALIDPAFFHKEIAEYVEENNIKLKYIIATHGHIDHIGGINDFKKIFDIPVVAHTKDADMFSSVIKNLSLWIGKPTKVKKPDILINGGETIEIGETKIEVLHTPGHTPGSISLWIPSEKTVIVGDLLFRGSIGRTDLNSGHYPSLIRSIRRKILPLGRDVRVIPGHGPETTIGEEIIDNPYLKKDEKELNS